MQLPGDSGGGAPLLVTLGFDAETFDRLDGLRRRYFPPDRNVVPAHISLFHDLPAEERDAVAAALADASAGLGPIALRFGPVRRLGTGMALGVEAPALLALHARLAREFRAWLTPQDRQPYRPHLTIMNKATPAAAAEAFDHVRAGWQPFEGIGDAIRLWAYLGGPWAPLDRHAFGGRPKPAAS